MELSSKPIRRWPARLLFLIRFCGLTGFFALAIGAVLIYLVATTTFELSGLAAKEADSFRDIAQRTYNTSEEALIHQLGNALFVAACLIVVGGVAVLFYLLIEGALFLRWMAASRSAAGLLTVVQIALALLLLFGVNVFSFRHYLRFDWTRDHRFTLPAKIQDDLRQLQAETTVIVYYQHGTLSRQSDKHDSYESAAARKVIEKVKDQVDQLREFGPQFRVEVIDVEVEGAADKLDGLTQDNPELRKALDASAENSIFFHAKREGKEYVQWMSFNEFYQLDKVASKASDNGQGNLILRDQGLDAFVHRILGLEEKRPRVGIAVVHELLSTQSSEDVLTLAGVRKSLIAHGFDVRDVILKKWSEFGPPEPTVATFEENEYEDLVDKLADLSASAKAFEEDVKTLEQVQEQWRAKTPDELTKMYAKQLGGRKVTEAMRRRQIEFFEDQLTFARAELARVKEEQDKTARDKDKLRMDRDSLIEQKRLSDLKAKFERLLADCDVLIVPRMTLMNVTAGEGIPARLHRLDQAQLDAIEDFMKAGKPVLACFGPSNEAADARRPPAPQGPDTLEEALGQLGFQFGKQTVLFNAETKSFAERRTGLLLSGVNVEVPPLDFAADMASARPLGGLEEMDAQPRKPNPLRVSMRIAAESLANELKLSVRHPRPITFDPEKAKSLPYEPEFLLTSKESWNDDNPFPSRERTPRPELTKPDDPARGTPDEKRRGPFCIGVAAEVPVPDSWYSQKSGTARKVRVAAIGHGHIFVGQELSPAKEQLLLNTCNWLLGREDHLAKEGQEWSYPRVHLPPLSQQLWHAGTQVGLPLLFFYLGVLVVLVRRLR